MRTQKFLCGVGIATSSVIYFSLFFRVKSFLLGKVDSLHYWSHTTVITMYTFTHKANGSHRLKYFRLSTFLQSGVYTKPCSRSLTLQLLGWNNSWLNEILLDNQILDFSIFFRAKINVLRNCVECFQSSEAIFERVLFTEWTNPMDSSIGSRNMYSKPIKLFSSKSVFEIKFCV